MATMMENETIKTAMTSGQLGEFTVQMQQGRPGEIDVTGNFFSEHLGQMSDNDITLSAMVMGDADIHANVNVATHAIHLRVAELMDSGMDLDTAVETATSELLQSMSDVLPAPANPMTLGDLVVMNAAMEDANQEGDAWLLAMSSIMEQVALKRRETSGSSMEEELQGILDEMAEDMAGDGVIHQQLLNEMLTARQRLNPDQLHTHLLDADGQLRTRMMAGHFGMSEADAGELVCDAGGPEIHCSGGGGMGGPMMQMMDLETMVANMNRFIDTDGDGIVNHDDDDDDNDGVPDTEDDTPYGE